MVTDKMISEGVEVFMAGVSPEPWDTESATALVRQILEAAMPGEGWKAYEDAERTASNAFDAEGLDYPVPQQQGILNAIKRGILMERERLKVQDVAGWFNSYNDVHGYQQVAKEFEGEPGTIPLYKAPVSKTSPEGWQLVPKEHTPEMEAAYRRAYGTKCMDISSNYPTEHPDDGGGPFGYGYRAMLAVVDNPPKL